MPVRTTSIQELEDLLSTLGVCAGATVMVHSAVFTLGRIESGLSGLYQAFRNLLGDEGTLIVPTFTYSFRRDQVFDVRNTSAAAEIGVFSEYVRDLRGVIRSPDPLFSMAAIGPEAASLMERPSHNCFGAESIYEKLFAADTLFAALGITYNTGLAAFMHLERLGGVSYRREMRFDGLSIGYDGKPFEDWAVHFAWDEKRYPRRYRDRDPIGLRMEKLHISKAVDFGSGHHFALRAQPFADYVLSELARDPHVMLVNEAGA